MSFFFFFLTFISCSGINQNIGYTKKWNGSDINGHNYATFEDFNGRQDFNIRRYSDRPFYLTYSMDIKKGKVRFEIKSLSRIILNKEVSGKLRDSIKLSNEGIEKIKVILYASNAYGSFDIKYNP